MIWLIFILAVLLVFGVLTASADLDVSTIGFLSSDVIQTNSVFWLLSFLWIVCALLSQKFWQKSKTTVGLIKNLSFGGFIFSTLGFLGLFVIQTLVIYQDFYQKIIEQFRHNLNGYQENECREVTLEGKPAYLLDYYWDTPEGPIYQLSVLYIVQNKLLTFTYSAQESFSPNKKEALLAVVYSFKTTSKTN